VQSYLENVLAPHAQCLRASNEWQIQLATSLFDAIDLVEGADNDIAQSFQPHRGFDHNQRPYMLISNQALSTKGWSKQYTCSGELLNVPGKGYTVHTA
jgi:hypothetical protein